jgi:hypothetical protein
VIGAITAGLFGTGVAASTNSYESIATQSVGAGGAASITFSSIPSTYKHLQIRFSANDDSQQDIFVRFNSDSATNYWRHYLYGQGSAVTAAADAAATNKLSLGYTSTTSNIFGAGVMDILDYANTSKNKTTRSLCGYDANGSGYVILFSGLWSSTAAINSITAFPTSGNFTQYSSFALYGIKG